MGQEYDDFFDNIGGGAPSFKFDGVGSVVSGEILDQFKTQQTAFGDNTKKLTFDDGTPRMQLNVTLQTNLRNWEKVAKIPTDEKGNEKPASEDDGKRRIFIKSDMQRAVGVAIRESEQGKGGLRNGGKLAVKLTGHKDVGKGNPLSLFEARYSPPAEGEKFFEDPKVETPASGGAAAGDDPWSSPSDTSTSSGWSDEPPF